MEKIDYSDIIRQSRQRTGDTQQSLSEKIGIARSTIALMETGTEPSKRTKRKFLEYAEIMQLTQEEIKYIKSDIGEKDFTLIEQKPFRAAEEYRTVLQRIRTEGVQSGFELLLTANPDALILLCKALTLLKQSQDEITLSKPLYGTALLEMHNIFQSICSPKNTDESEG